VIKKYILLASMGLLVIANSQATGQTLSDALKPHLEIIRDGMQAMPPEYRQKHTAELERYLGLLSTANGVTCNRELHGLVKSMGPDFNPLWAAVTEALKVTEAYEAALPDPEKKLPKIAQAVLAGIPTNTVLFINCDVLETTVLIQQQAGLRQDVILLNSARILDKNYLKIILARYPKRLSFDPVNILKKTIEEVIDRKKAGDQLFKDVQIVNDKASFQGIALVYAVGVVLMHKIVDTVPDRPVLFMPALYHIKSVAMWQDMHGFGIFFTWKKPKAKKPNSTLANWKDLIDAAVPEGGAVHTEMANAIQRSLQAAYQILAIQENTRQARALYYLWSQRRNTIKLVSGSSIKSSH
jgi:hypothetical protein